jgi:glycerol-3-phosphate dehydrogenase
VNLLVGKNGIINLSVIKRKSDTEILIVGGGITGSLIAHQCMADGLKPY